MNLKNLKNLKSSKSMSVIGFYYIFGPILLNSMNFLTLPIFTRVLGAENFGVYSLFSTWASVVTILFGLQITSTIGPAAVRLEKDDYREYISSILALVTGSFIILTIVGFIFGNTISKLLGLDKLLISWMIAQSFGTLLVNFTLEKYRFDKEAYRVFKISIITSISTTISSLVLLVIIKERQYLYLSKVYGITIPTVLIGIFYYMRFIKSGKKLFSLRHWKFCLSFCLPLIFQGLSNIVLDQSDRVMLQQFTNKNSVGIYSFAYSLTNILIIVYSALNNTWIPFYFDFIKNRDIRNIKKKTKVYVEVFTIITSGFILVSPEMVKILSSYEFWDSINIIPILALSMYFIFLYSFPVNFEFYHMKTTFIAIGTLSAAVCNIILNMILIPQIGVYGAAVATLISYVLLFIFHQYIATHIIKQKYHYKFNKFLPGIFVVIVTVIIGHIFEGYPVIRWSLGIILGAFLLIKIIKRKAII